MGCRQVLPARTPFPGFSTCRVSPVWAGESLPSFQEFANEWPQVAAVPRIGEGELDEGTEVAFEVADVVAALPRRELHADHLAAVVDEQANGVSQLDLATLARLGLCQPVEDHRLEYIPGRHRQV